MRKWLALGFLLWPGFAMANALPYFKLQAFAYSEPIPVHQLDDTDPDFERGEIALTHNWAEIGMTYNGFGLGILGRYDYDLKFSKDASEFFYRVNNKLPLEQGQEFDLEIEAKHVRSTGLRLSYDRSISNKIRLNVGLSYLKGILLTDGQIEGRGVALSDKDYDFQFDVDYYYSNDVIFERQTASPTGRGYSLDFSLSWQIDKKTGFTLNVIDLVGKMYWQNAPYTTATASSDVKEYDDNGYLIYKPVLSGLETNYNFTQKLDPQIKGLLDYQWQDDVAVLARFSSYRIANFYQLGLRYSPNAVSSYIALFMLEHNAVSLGYEMDFFNIMFTSDALDLHSAHTLGVSLNLFTAF